MNQNWEYKKLGEVATIEYGTRVVKQKDGGSLYPVYGGGGETFRMDIYNRENRVVVSRFAMSPQCTRRVEGKFFLNDSGLTLKSNDDGLLQLYLDTFIISVNDKIYSLGRGAAQKNLKVDDFLKLLIPVPSHDVQQRIVSELDLLSSIHDKQKAQLKEMDNLAQSIFYDMFGDPVENEKGWEVVPFMSVGEFGRGVSKYRPRNAPELLGGTMPLIQTGEVANSGMYITEYHSTYSDLGVSQSRVWSKGTICITIAANIGKCSILTFDACFPDSVVGFVPNGKVIKEYVYYIFLSLQAILERNAPGVAQKNINLQILNSLELPLPPHALQQEFASKIQAIESQKAAIAKSMEETQKLFDYTMDKYFG